MIYKVDLKLADFGGFERKFGGKVEVILKMLNC